MPLHREETMRELAVLVLVLTTLTLSACNTIPEAERVGAVNVAERTITLYAEPKTPKTPQDLMAMTKGQIRVGEMYEVLRRERRVDEEYGYATDPVWLFLMSRERPELRGWALADPIAAKRLNP
jgi:hypothetical protein